MRLAASPHRGHKQGRLSKTLRIDRTKRNHGECREPESSDIVEDTPTAVEEKLAYLKHISGIINFHCILRTLELKKKGMTEAYGKIFSEIPTDGFSTYGEEFIGHINQTATMLVFE